MNNTDKWRVFVGMPILVVLIISLIFVNAEVEKREAKREAMKDIVCLSDVCWNKSDTNLTTHTKEELLIMLDEEGGWATGEVS